MNLKPKINQVYASIKFDFYYSSNSVNFLDTTVKKSSMVDTLFKKETDCQDYLHRKSEHPESLKHSIPYAQVLRLKRICTEDCNFKGNCDILLKNLIDREYKKAEPFDRNRENLLTQNNELKACVRYF